MKKQTNKTHRGMLTLYITGYIVFECRQIRGRYLLYFLNFSKNCKENYDVLNHKIIRPRALI